MFGLSVDIFAIAVSAPDSIRPTCISEPSLSSSVIGEHLKEINKREVIPQFCFVHFKSSDFCSLHWQSNDICWLEWVIKSRRRIERRRVVP